MLNMQGVSWGASGGDCYLGALRSALRQLQLHPGARSYARLDEARHELSDASALTGKRCASSVDSNPVFLLCVVVTL